MVVKNMLAKDFEVIDMLQEANQVTHFTKISKADFKTYSKGTVASIKMIRHWDSMDYLESLVVNNHLVHLFPYNASFNYTKKLSYLVAFD